MIGRVVLAALWLSSRKEFMPPEGWLLVRVIGALGASLLAYWSYCSFTERELGNGWFFACEAALFYLLAGYGDLAGNYVFRLLVG